MRESLHRARDYELMVILSPDVSEEAIPAAIERVAGFVSAVKGDVTTVNRDSPWGRRRLAYPIRHESRDVRDGFYVLYYFRVDSDQIIEIERELKLNTQIIRHMMTLQVAPPAFPEPEPEDDDETAADAPFPAVTGDEAAVATDERAPDGPDTVSPDTAQAAIVAEAAEDAAGDAGSQADDDVRAEVAEIIDNPASDSETNEPAAVAPLDDSAAPPDRVEETTATVETESSGTDDDSAPEVEAQPEVSEPEVAKTDDKQSDS